MGRVLPIERSDVGCSLFFGRLQIGPLRSATSLDPQHISKPACMLQACGMLAMPAHVRAAMQNIPFSEPPAFVRKRQIPLNGDSARVLVVDDRRANVEALAASLAIDGLKTRFA